VGKTAHAQAPAQLGKPHYRWLLPSSAGCGVSCTDCAFPATHDMNESLAGTPPASQTTQFNRRSIESHSSAPFYGVLVACRQTCSCLSCGLMLYLRCRFDVLSRPCCAYLIVYPTKITPPLLLLYCTVKYVHLQGSWAYLF